jgi:hypothetical protein
VQESSAFPDHFSARAESYAKFRPGYPPALFDYLASLPASRGRAWDCATGNGQAASGLARHFDEVIATDASAAQIANAEPCERVVYGVAPAEASGIEAETVDLVTVAQAIHWLDVTRFWSEVRRVAARGAVLAFWTYNLPRCEEGVDRVLRRFYSEVVGPYWPPERRWIEEDYRTIDVPFEAVSAPAFEIVDRWDLARLFGYLSTWSAVRNYLQRTGGDPIAVIRTDLCRAWGDPARTRRLAWPLVVRASRVRPEGS